MILRFFDANRLTNQLAANGHIESISNMKAQGKNESLLQDSSDKFERYLVGYYNYGSHVIAREKILKNQSKLMGGLTRLRVTYKISSKTLS